VDDVTAVARARAGDPEAFALLAARHADQAHRVAALLGAGADADDVVQEALVKALAALEHFRAGAPFRPWLLRIVANEAHNATRSAQRRTGAHERFAAAAPAESAAESAEAAVLRAQRQAAIRGAVRALPENYRLAVTCRYLLDLSEEETAARLGWPRGSVKSRLARALAQLRSALADDRPIRTVT
jgi:RNA polymerase sigma factor (sigma-70 family)